MIPRNLNSYVGVVNQPPLQWGGAGKRLLHTNFAPGYAPEPEQKPVCRQFSRCEGCPYPSHGFLCWSSEDDCMRTRMKKLNGKGARHLLNSGENITMKQIQIWLGHSTYSTTADIYAHLDHNAQQVPANTMMVCPLAVPKIVQSKRYKKSWQCEVTASSGGDGGIRTHVRLPQTDFERVRAIRT